MKLQSKYIVLILSVLTAFTFSCMEPYLETSEKNLDYQIQEIDISIDLLEKADEAFLTNSTQFLVPISSLNKKIIGSGQAGKYSCELYEKFKKISRYS